MIETIVRDTVARYGMVLPGERVVVAVSGGPDSIALLSILRDLAPELNAELHVAHLDHGWRGRASALDAEFVRRTALRFGLPVTIGHARGLPAAARRQSSREAQGREMRYAFLRDVAREAGAQRVALGHTRDDQAESLLLRLVRGSGARGLAGIYPVIDGLFIRPLFGVRREAILAYLKSRRLRYRTDATNRDPAFSRNRVRLRLLPRMERDFNPRVVEALANAADILREEDAFLQDAAVSLYKKMMTERGGAVQLQAGEMRGLPAALRRRVLRLAIEAVRGSLRRVALPHVERSLSLLEPGHGGAAIVLPGGVEVARRAGVLEVAPAARRTPAPSSGGCREALCPVPGEVALDDLDLRLRARIVERDSLAVDLDEAGSERAFLDADLVEGPLLVRPRRRGDRFVPLGGPGTRRLKAFLIDRKVPPPDRERIPLVVCRDRIAWVVGHRIDDRFKVTGATRRVLVLERITG